MPESPGSSDFPALCSFFPASGISGQGRLNTEVVYIGFTGYGGQNRSACELSSGAARAVLFCAAVMLPDEHRNIGCRAVRALYQSKDEIMEKSAGIVQNDMRKKKIVIVNSRSNFHSGKRGRSYHGKADVTMKKPITTAENQYSIHCNESSAEHIYTIMNGEKVMKYSFPKGKHGKQPKSR